VIGIYGRDARRRKEIELPDIANLLSAWRSRSLRSFGQLTFHACLPEGTIQKKGEPTRIKRSTKKERFSSIVANEQRETLRKSERGARRCIVAVAWGSICATATLLERKCLRDLESMFRARSRHQKSPSFQIEFAADGDTK